MTASRFAATAEGEVTDLAGDDTMFGPQFGQQAWSAGEQPTESQPYREPHSWASVARRAAVALGVGIAAAGVVITLGIHHSSASPPATDAPMAIPTSRPVDTMLMPLPPAPPPVIPDIPDVPDAQPITHDGEYLHTLTTGGITIIDPAAALSSAQLVCRNLEVIPSHEALAMWAMRHDNTATPFGPAKSAS